MVFSRTATPAHLKCQDCGDLVARPGYAPSPGISTMGEHVAAHRVAVEVEAA